MFDHQMPQSRFSESQKATPYETHSANKRVFAVSMSIPRMPQPLLMENCPVRKRKILRCLFFGTRLVLHEAGNQCLSRVTLYQEIKQTVSILLPLQESHTETEVWLVNVHLHSNQENPDISRQKRKSNLGQYNSVRAPEVKEPALNDSHRRSICFLLFLSTSLQKTPQVSFSLELLDRCLMHPALF